MNKCNNCIFQLLQPELCANMAARAEGKGCLLGIRKASTSKSNLCLVCGKPSDETVCKECKQKSNCD